MFCISLNYKLAPVEMREQFSFSSEKQTEFLNALKNNNIPQSVFLATCNRTEVYGTGNAYTALEILCDFAQADNSIKNNILIFEGEGAIKHLFRVTCGIDSMVLGEDEILGQIKKAYAFSKHNGFTEFELNTVFQAAVTSAKKIKTNTLISKTSVSVATLAASYCHKLRQGKKTALVVGSTGEIGSKLIKNLLSYGDFEIYCAKRNGKTAGGNITDIPYEARYDYADRADIIISATKSPHFTITLDRLRKAIKADKQRLIIDLAVPRDVDSSVAEINSVTLLTVDDFNRLAQKNNKAKLSAVKNAEEIIDDDIETLIKELDFHKLLPKLQQISDDELKRFIYNFRDTANSKEFESFVQVLSKTEVQ